MIIRAEAAGQAAGVTTVLAEAIPYGMITGAGLPSVDQPGWSHGTPHPGAKIQCDLTADHRGPTQLGVVSGAVRSGPRSDAL